MEQSKKMQKASPSKSPNGDAEQSCENSVKGYVYLTYDVLRLVFQYLRGRDLSNAAMVCRIWYEAAIREQSIRGPVYFIGRYSSITNKIKDLCIKPRIGILFISRMSGRVEEKIRDHHMLPSDCEVITLYCPGVIINNVEVQYFTYALFVCAFLPRMPNVCITTSLAMKLDKRTKRISEQLIEKINSQSKVKDETSVCLMLFCNDGGCTLAKKMIVDIRKSGADKKIDSLWGGVADIGYVKNSSCQTPYCLGILISGAIKTWSIVIDKKCNTKEQIEKRLRSFKDRVTLKKHSIAFMCACTARGDYMHNDVNVESTIFKTMFPNVLLVGFFGDGEFGKNTMDFDHPKEGACLSNQSKSDECKHNHRKETWYNQFSTIFMILTYG